MSLLPTAHAGQLFGSRRIDFFTVSGHVSDADHHHGCITDNDGMDHDVRLMEKTEVLASGDVATVLRVQSGPNRRSRAVAIIDHSRGTWLRASPDATTILARSGITRSFNWWLSILLLVALAAASVWPTLHFFLTEMNAGMMSGVPVFDLFADLGARMPGLSSWRLENALPAGIRDALAGLNFMPMESLTEWGLYAAAALMAIVSFAARSWRLIYVPLFAVLAVVSGAVFGGADTTLSMIGGALALFTLGGLVNRIRDGGRFNARVERLADHVLRNPPQEGVRSSEAPALAEGAAAAAIATATAVAEAAPAEAAPAEEAPAEEAAAAESVDAVAEVETPENAGEVSAEDTETDAADDASAEASVSVAAAPDTTETSDDTAEATPEATPEPATAEETANDDAASDDTASDDTAGETVAETEDDDLPSLEEVKAAAAMALAEAESESPDTIEADAAPEIDLEDERTMPVAPPPPMPAAAEAAPVEAETPAEDTATETAAPADDTASDEPVAEETADSNSTDEPVMSAEAPDPVEVETVEAIAPEADLPENSEPVAQAAPVEPAPVAAEPAIEAASDPVNAANDDYAAPVDDPLIDDASDPMIGDNDPGDYAPGAPEIEFDKSPAE